MVTIYILQLEQGKYYVGKTTCPKFRLQEHFNQTATAWTTKHHPIGINEIIEGCDSYDEDKYTLMYMEKYGINNVRGGSFCEMELTAENQKTIQRMIHGSSDRCYICGEKGHFANHCPNNQEKTNSWFTQIINTITKQIKRFTQWDCSYCGKPFDTEKGCRFHENIHCKKRKKITPSKQQNQSKTSTCYRCGRKGHYAGSCYAKKHLKGYYLKTY